MINDLPEELIAQIMSYLTFPVELAFSDTSDAASFPACAALTSAILVVSKRWLRIARPLLYRTIIVRSNTQADDLALTLRGNKQLGRCIDKLRIEGGYGSVIYNVIKAASNVTHLSLTLYVSSSDKVSGLCRALPMMKPVHVILYDRVRRGLDNASVRALHKTICDCMRRWKSMVCTDSFLLLFNVISIRELQRTLYFPYSEAGGLHSTTAPIDMLAEAIRDAPSLQEVIIPFAYSYPRHLSVIAQNPRLRVICVQRKREHGGATFSFEHGIHGDPRLRALVIFQETEM
jgi:hypothetical protein